MYRASFIIFIITNKCTINPTTCTFSTHPTQQPAHSLHIQPNNLHILYASNPTTCTFSTHQLNKLHILYTSFLNSLHIIPDNLHILYTSFATTCTFSAHPTPIKVYITTVYCVIYIITQRDFCDIYFYYIICLLVIITNLKKYKIK
jgi:hypothetical protein